MKFLVLGAGTQGSAAAYDLLRDRDVDRVVMADAHARKVHPALRPHLGERLDTALLDARSEDQALEAMTGVTGVLCALPYYFNHAMARLAVEAGVHFADLGGNTEIVHRQRGLDARAKARGLSLVPDTGLAPGLINVLAQAGIDEMDEATSVRMCVGGLPRNPKPPLRYQIVYSLEGVLDYYVTPALVLANGKRTVVDALSGLEEMRFPEPVGRLEAFYTAGGVSTMPDRYEDRIATLEYKTLRYPGHAAIMRAIRDLGLLDDKDVSHRGGTVNPRAFFVEQAAPRLTNPEGDDVVVARAEVAGRRGNQPHHVRYDVVDHYDDATGFTAMARTTGFSLSVTALMQARGHVAGPGVRTPDEALPSRRFMGELAQRGVHAPRFELDAQDQLQR